MKGLSDNGAISQSVAISKGPWRETVGFRGARRSDKLHFWGNSMPRMYRYMYMHMHVYMLTSMQSIHRRPCEWPIQIYSLWFSLVGEVDSWGFGLTFHHLLSTGNHRMPPKQPQVWSNHFFGMSLVSIPPSGIDKVGWMWNGCLLFGGWLGLHDFATSRMDWFLIHVITRWSKCALWQRANALTGPGARALKMRLRDFVFRQLLSCLPRQFWACNHRSNRNYSANAGLYLGVWVTWKTVLGHY